MHSANQRARAEQLKNLYSVLARPDDPLLPEPVDLVLIVNTYHHIGGRKAVEARLTTDEVTRELSEAGYEKKKTHDLLPHQYVVEFHMR